MFAMRLRFRAVVLVGLAEALAQVVCIAGGTGFGLALAHAARLILALQGIVAFELVCNVEFVERFARRGFARTLGAVLGRTRTPAHAAACLGHDGPPSRYEGPT